jgi:excisionase family DNA binding protein
MNANCSPTGLWNKQQAAEYLGIAVSTLNHWICDRKIVFVKIGTLVKFRKADLDRFIARNVRGKPGSPKDDETLPTAAKSKGDV